LSVITEGDEWTMEESGVHDGVSDSHIEERRKIPESVVEMVGEVPSRVTGAEALLGIARGGGQVDRRTVIQGLVGVIQLEVVKKLPTPIPGTAPGLFFLIEDGVPTKFSGTPASTPKCREKLYPRADPRS
jgi:hypothetical protein